MRDEAKISSEESGSVNNYSQSLIFRKPAVRSRNGLVTANHRLAAEAGAEILAMGGNAIDAAITTSMMLGVCEHAGHPHSLLHFLLFSHLHGRCLSSCC